MKTLVSNGNNFREAHIDYAYTINGWIKGVNSSITNPSYDMGEDGNVHNPSTLTIGRDAFGFTLNYFQGDYKAIGNSAMEATGLPQTSMYNGNIAAATYSIPSLNPKTIGYSYSYDQLNRYTALQAYNNVDTVANNWSTGTAIPDFKENVSYDENGNILTYLRHGNTIGTGTHLAMDSLNYFYNKGTNQLNHVTDAVPSTYYPNDIHNESANNYKYNKIGELAKDIAAGIDTITWTVYGKVKRVIKTNGDSIVFFYDPMGNRIEKLYYPHGATSDTTEYVREASGNILAVYDKKKDTLRLSEYDIYGSSRIGTLDTSIYVSSVPSYGILGGPPPPPPCCWPPPCSCGDTTGIDSVTTAYIEGQKQYELTNHLGNVFVTLSDKKIPVDTITSDTAAKYYLPLVITAQDYYPFGMLQPGRLFSSKNYRFAYNKGSEKDDEIYGIGNAYTTFDRELDVRLPRWWAQDPKTKAYESPYVAFSDNPIVYNDPTGDDPDDKNTKGNSSSQAPPSGGGYQLPTVEIRPKSFLSKVGSSLGNFFSNVKEAMIHGIQEWASGTNSEESTASKGKPAFSMELGKLLEDFDIIDATTPDAAYGTSAVVHKKPNINDVGGTALQLGQDKSNSKPNLDAGKTKAPAATRMHESKDYEMIPVKEIISPGDTEQGLEPGSPENFKVIEEHPKGASEDSYNHNDVEAMSPNK